MSQFIQHSSHSHILISSFLENGYRCNFCREGGMGWSYRCHTCNFDVHPICARAPPLLYHPFHNYSGHQLILNPRPPRQNPPPCYACGNNVEGFGYDCAWGSCGYVLHPSCAQFPENRLLPTPVGHNEQMLRLLPSLTYACDCCGEGGFGWAYATNSRTFNIHLRCVKREMDGSARRHEIELERAAAMPVTQAVAAQQPKHVGNTGNRGSPPRAAARPLTQTVVAQQARHVSNAGNGGSAQRAAATPLTQALVAQQPRHVGDTANRRSKGLSKIIIKMAFKIILESLVPGLSHFVMN